MRRTEVKGFVVYDFGEGIIFQRGKFNHLSYEEKISVLSQYNISIVMGMSGKEDTDLVKIPGLMYVYCPIADGKLHKEPISTMFHLAYKAAEAIYYQKATVLSYCYDGRNRSGLMNALILRDLYGLSGKDAMEMVREHRPRAINNLHFEEFLSGLEAPVVVI
jgi:hypothetical protein